MEFPTSITRDGGLADAVRFLGMEEWQSDPGADQLLPGEAASVGSGRRDDAVHWLRVYEELCGFKQKLLAVLGEQASSVERDGWAEVDRDATMFRREADRLARRVEFWRGEAKRLGG